ncbi:MAG: Flp pilus assembly complex ATPase component TadA [Burkholderiales bacterium]|nr:Flp pilus assembly complex ATPase component TadA [Burkholderiales bacterium]
MNAPPPRAAAGAAPPQKPLGRILVERGILSEDQLRIALKEQQRTNQPLGKALKALGFVTEATLRDALSENLGATGVDLAHIIIDPAAISAVPREFAKRHMVFPLEMDRRGRRFAVAMSDPNNVVALDQLRAHLLSTTKEAFDVLPLLAGESEIARAIDQYFGYELSIDGILNEIETGEIDYQSLSTTTNEYSQPMVRLVDALLADAVQRGASDIHFEPEQNFLRIRYRVDGVLRQIRALHKQYWPAMVVRIKVMSQMNIAETRAPQDGRISLSLTGRVVDFRVAAQPTTHGENVVLRILDRQRGLVPLDKLGLQEEQLGLMKLMIARPEGIILVTGPTGSGKTTTLYSILNHINSEGVNIMTLEDPVEYPMNMVRQSSVNEAVKLDFATGIRSLMRQDPDVILVGEIRDADTAEMAFRAAMTGHQVYSTLHTNSAIGAIPRLLDIGILPDIMAGNIVGVVAQRLIRRLCPHCKEPRRAEPVECRIMGIDPDEAPTIHHAVGCEHCEYRGYRGRLAIMEVLKMDFDLDELVARRATTRELTQLALAKGFVPLAEDAVRRVLDGSTTIEEVARVVDFTGRVMGAQ